MNLKKTTKDKLYAMLCEEQEKRAKDKLYAMLCEEQEKRAEAEKIIEKQAENAHTWQEKYLSLEKESEKRIEALNDELIKANVEIAGLRRERDEMKDICADRTKDIEYYDWEYKKLRAALDEQNAHPWRHLWKCLWR